VSITRRQPESSKLPGRLACWLKGAARTAVGDGGKTRGFVPAAPCAKLATCRIGGTIEGRVPPGGVIVSDPDKRVAVRLEELALANSLTPTALVELLEEKGVLNQAEVLERIRKIRDKTRGIQGRPI
jgi:hypothetical protein